MSRVLIVSGCIAAFCISHVYLQFAIADVKVGFRDLQIRRTALERQASRLEHVLIESSDLSRLQHKAADEFGLVEDDTLERSIAVIPPSYSQKYADGIETRSAYAAHPETERRTALGRMLENLVDGNWAFAETNR